MKHRRIGVIFILLTVLSVCSGCISMKAVKDYSSYSRKTVESVNPVAMDFYDSCMRSNIYKPFASISECKNEQEVTKQILKVAAVLNAYGEALGALAGDELVDYSTDVTKLTNEVKNLKSFDDKKVDALGKLSQLIASAATSAYQQKEVVKFIKDCNDSVVTVTNGLADVIDKNYSEAIGLEISAWEDGYKRVEKKARDDRPLDWGNFSKAQWQTRSDLTAKLSASKGLAEGVRAIGKTR